LADAGAIAAVHEASRVAAFREHLPPEILYNMSMEERVARWREWLLAPDAVTFAASRDGRIVGFGTLAPASDDDTDPRRICEMPTLYVHPDHWRQGIGRALCEAVIGLARERGFATLVLWTMETNDAARVFYESLGFQADGAKKKDPGAPSSTILAIRFRLDLDKRPRAV
jgi:GNAT superfamily N-acetyltransferase